MQVQIILLSPCFFLFQNVYLESYNIQTFQVAMFHLIICLTFLHVFLWLNSSFPFVCMLGPFSHVCFFVTLKTVAHQAPLSMGFSKQEYCSGLPFPSARDLHDPGMEPTSLMFLALTGGFFKTSAPWKPSFPLVPKSILLSGCTTVYPFTNWRSSWFTLDLEIMNKAAINMHLQDFVWA